MLRALLVALVVLAPSLALAAQAPRPPAPREIVIDEDGVIEGTGTGPDVEDITVTPRTHHQNLIKLRSNFAEKVVRSVSEL